MTPYIAKPSQVELDTENIKISHLLNKEYLQKVLHKGNGIMKIEYSKRTENVYKIMNRFIITIFLPFGKQNPQKGAF